MNKLIVFVLLTLSWGLLTKLSYAIEPNQHCLDIRELYEDIRNDTILSFSHHERKIIRAIDIEAIVAASFSQAGAYFDPIKKRRVIVFSCTHMALIGQAAEAMAYLATLSEPEKTRAKRAIEGYLRYLIHSVSFSIDVMSFPEFVGFDAVEKSPPNFEHVAFSFRYQMATSVLFHEFGHHVLNHVSQKAYSAAFSRNREQEADKWAVRSMLKNGMLPMVTTVLFKMLNELNDSDLKDEWKLTHPASLKRAIYYFENGMAAFDDPRIIAAFEKNKDTTGITLKSAKATLRQMRRTFATMLVSETQKANDPLTYWNKLALDQNTLGLIEMAYIHGGKYGVKKDLARAQGYFCLAARYEDEDYSYDYVSKARAHYLCGYSYAFLKADGVKRDLVKGRYHLNISAKMGYLWAQAALRHLDK